MKILRYLPLFFLFSFLHNLFSTYLPPKTVRFSTINSDKGLSNNWVNCIVEDDRGFIWVGTRSGLNIFDGTNVEVIKNINQDKTKINFNDVSYLEKTKANNIIVGTWGRGIYIINPKTKKVINKQENIFEKSLNVKKTIERKDGSIIIATFGNGLVEYDPTSNQYIPFKQPQIKSHEESFIFIDNMILKNDTILLTNADGELAFVAPNSLEIKLLKNSNKEVINFGFVSAINTHKNRLILGTKVGEIYFLNPSNYTILKKINVSNTKKEKIRIKDFCYDDKGLLWIITTESIFKYNEIKDELEELASTKSEDEYKSIFCCYKDSRNIVWFGSWGNGLHYSNDSIYSFSEINLGNNSNFVVTDIVTYDFRNLLIGTSKGLLIYDFQAKTHNKFSIYSIQKKKINNPDIAGVIPYEDKFLIKINEYGFFFMDKKGFLSNISGINHFLISDITSNYITKNKEHWIGSQTRGMIKIKEGVNIAEEYFYDAKSYNTLKTKSILSITQSKNGIIWIGTRDGLFKYQREGNTFVKEEIHLRIKAEAIPITTVKAIKEDNQGNLWLGTAYGLIKYDVENKVEKVIGTGNEVMESLIYNFFLIDNYMWATTKGGLIRINTLTNEFAVYTTNSGLLSNSFNDRGVYFSEKENLLYLSNLNSIIYFDPKSKVESKSKLKIILKDFSVNDQKASSNASILPKTISNLSTIVLNHNQNNIAFELSIQDFSPNINGKLYAVKLVGQDKDFVYYNYGEKVIRFTNLPPKEYQLLIYSVNQDGSIGKELNKIDIIIQKPFWLTYWFILLIIGLLGAFFYFKIKTKKKPNLHNVSEYSTLGQINVTNEPKQPVLEQNYTMNNTEKHAALIQKSNYPNKQNITPYFKDYFIVQSQKKPLSSDFYWLSNTNEKTIIALGDCGTLGLSDSFLSIIVLSQLKTIVEVNSIFQPDLILKELDKELITVLADGNKKSSTGIGLSIVCIDHKHNSIEISSAMNTVFLQTKTNEIIQSKETKKHVGIENSYAEFGMEKHTLSNISMLYLLSDGFQNQIGGENVLEYSLEAVKEFFYSIAHLKTIEQSKLIENELYVWQGKNPQTDDILVWGLKL